MSQPPAVTHPTVTVLSTTPVKGLQLHHPEEIQVDSSGAVGDRDFFLIDDRHRLVSITRCGGFVGWTAHFDVESGVLTFRSDSHGEVAGEVRRGKPVVADFAGDRGVPAYLAEGPWDDVLSGLAGRTVRLVRASSPGDGSDEHPISLMSEESVAELARHASVDRVDPRRFRMTIQIRGVRPHEEDAWRRQHLQVGGCVLRVGGPVPRCAAVTRNPETGEVDLRTLHVIRDYRGVLPNEFGDGLNFGVYAEVVTPGRIRVGDEVGIVPRP